jgi:hypothetical protein
MNGHVWQNACNALIRSRRLERIPLVLLFLQQGPQLQQFSTSYLLTYIVPLSSPGLSSKIEYDKSMVPWGLRGKQSNVNWINGKRCHSLPKITIMHRRQKGALIWPIYRLVRSCVTIYINFVSTFGQKLRTLDALRHGDPVNQENRGKNGQKTAQSYGTTSNLPVPELLRGSCSCNPTAANWRSNKSALVSVWKQELKQRTLLLERVYMYRVNMYREFTLADSLRSTMKRTRKKN